MKYLLVALVFITIPLFAERNSIGDFLQENFEEKAREAEDLARDYQIMGDELNAQYYLGKANAFRECISVVLSSHNASESSQH